jgi:hypothetical protein
MGRVIKVALAAGWLMVATSVVGCFFNPQPDPPADALGNGAGTNQGGTDDATTGGGAVAAGGSMTGVCSVGGCGGDPSIGGAPPGGGMGGVGGAGGALGGAGGAGGN